MDIVLTIFAVLVLGFIVNVFYKQTYNFIFFIGKMPILWIISVVLVALLFWYISSKLGWSVSIPAWASIMAFFMNYPPSLDKDQRQIVIDVYEDMGIKNGVAMSRIGLFGFVVSSVIAWVMFYGQSCNSVGQCSPIF